MPLDGFWYFSSVRSSTILDTVNLTVLLTQLFYLLDFDQFIPPKSRVNTKFFRDKPTLRLVREKKVSCSVKFLAWKQALFLCKTPWNWIQGHDLQLSSTSSSKTKLRKKD